MEKYDAIPSAGLGSELTPGSLRMFKVSVAGAVGLSLTSVIMAAVWLGHFKGGFAWNDNPQLQFNFHPLFMIVGMVFMYGNAILVYRVLPSYKKIYIKILHALLHILALVFAGVGLKAVFDSHNLPVPSIPNLYSLHSWLGLITIILFALQWLCGLVTFLVPGLTPELRGLYKPVHVFWGIAIFLMAVGTALMGLVEKEFFSNDEYKNKNPEGVLVNMLGLVLVILAFVMGYILTNSAYQRQPLPEEDQMQLTH